MRIRCLEVCQTGEQTYAFSDPGENEGKTELLQICPPLPNSAKQKIYKSMFISGHKVFFLRNMIVPTGFGDDSS